MNSRQLARLIGPTLSVMTLSEMINISIWEGNIPSVIFLDGVLLFVAGISIIRVHNFRECSWTILITLTGWLTLLLGLFRMFFPTAKRGNESFSMYLLLTVLFVIGLFLAFKGYYPIKTSTDNSRIKLK